MPRTRSFQISPLLLLNYGFGKPARAGGTGRVLTHSPLNTSVLSPSSPQGPPPITHTDVNCLLFAQPMTAFCPLLSPRPPQNPCPAWAGGKMEAEIQFVTIPSGGNADSKCETSEFHWKIHLQCPLATLKSRDDFQELKCWHATSSTCPAFLPRAENNSQNSKL